ncbi:MAG: hypothetical protein EZS28_008183 [Streblomastix strix]|uniref:Uncharacterized protein n=1 Tax=Streblomastix strix TaxID=222440 RepID=A0A5J4WMS5_9EUKA|nr:MAG: hypothetical protein EZS28_008183 [Streblomastix strix]
MRKGADVLSKWVGETERQLRLLFATAQQNAPSIIFFDEIDGLAPVRSAKQDHIHSSVVATLLSLMDGLDSRDGSGDGKKKHQDKQIHQSSSSSYSSHQHSHSHSNASFRGVVVIAATNRPDNVDPALRRPGRFDREFVFSLPDRNARLDILKIHTRNWKPKPPNESILESVANATHGCTGADLKAISTEALLSALRRTHPQIYKSDGNAWSGKIIIPTLSDFEIALHTVSPSGQRSAADSHFTGQALQQPHFTLLRPYLSDLCTRIRKAIGEQGSGQLSASAHIIFLLEPIPVIDLSFPALLSDNDSGTAEEALAKRIRNALTLSKQKNRQQGNQQIIAEASYQRDFRILARTVVTKIQRSAKFRTLDDDIIQLWEIYADEYAMQLKKKKREENKEKKNKKKFEREEYCYLKNIHKYSKIQFHSKYLYLNIHSQKVH